MKYVVINLRFSFVDRVSVDVAVSNGENLIVIEKVARENKIDLKNYRFLRQSLPEGNVLLRSAMMTQMMIIIIIKTYNDNNKKLDNYNNKKQ